MVYEQDDTEQEFIDLTDDILEVVDEANLDTAFVASGAVMLNKLEELLASGEDMNYVVTIANQIYLEFVGLMGAFGFDLSERNKQ